MKNVWLLVLGPVIICFTHILGVSLVCTKNDIPNGTTFTGEFFFRFRWEPHSIAFWDNRCCNHYAINDYLPDVRSGYRVQIEGHAPPVAG